MDVTQIASKEITVAHNFVELRLAPDEYTITLYLHGKLQIIDLKFTFHSNIILLTNDDLL